MFPPSLSIARAILIQRRMLAANHRTELEDPNEGARERTEGAERICNLMGITKLSTNETHHSSQGLKHQPVSSHGETHGSRYICSRGQQCLTSMGGEAFDLVKAHVSSVGEHQDTEVGEGALSWRQWERRETGIGRKGITPEM